MTPALKRGACGQTPPHLSVPGEACGFGFVVRSIGGTGQLPRLHPAMPDDERAERDMPGPHQIGVQGGVALTAHQEQARLRAVLAAGVATARAGLAGRVGSP
jgi:hypothetical protein